MNQSIASTFQQRRLKEVAVLFASLIVLLALPTFLLHQYTGRSWIEGFFISCFGAIAMFLIYIMVRRYFDRGAAGAILLDLGPAPPLQTSLKFSLSIQMLMGVIVLIVGWISPDQSSFLWFGGALILAPATSFMSIGGRYQICENGLLLVGILIRWSDIRIFEWDGLHLWVRSRHKMIRFSECRVSIPEDQQEAVDELLRKYVGTTGTQESD